MAINHIFLIIFAVVTAVYLATLFFKQGLFQSVLKGCLVPLVLAVYIFGAEKILLPVILALVFGWAGDVFLLKIEDINRFRLGLASFLAGHICYIIAMFNYTQPFNITVLFVSIALAAVLGFLIFRIVLPGNEMKIPVIAYEAVIMTMVIFALQVFVTQGALFGTLVFAGSLCFMVSDSILAFDTFRRKTRYGYFLVMLTYIAAQLLIALGFCMPGV